MSHSELKYRVLDRFALSENSFWSGFFFFLGFSAYFQAIKRIRETSEIDALREDAKMLNFDSRKVVEKLRFPYKGNDDLIDTCHPTQDA